MLSRQVLTAHLTSRLAQSPHCRAAWLAGSDATGRTDAYSDIDLSILCRGDSAPAVLDLVRESLLALSPIDLEWQVPRPTWHGHDQTFFRLAAAGPHLLLDVALISDTSAPCTWFLEPERHGTPQVLLDPEGLIKPQPFDRPSHEQKLRARLARIRAVFPLFQTLVTRSIERGLPVDAAAFYHTFTLQPLVEALRMLYCPDRFDFGLRYLRDDLPAAEYQLVSRLALPGSLEGIRARQREAETRFAAAMTDLSARYPVA